MRNRILLSFAGVLAPALLLNGCLFDPPKTKPPPPPPPYEKATSPEAVLSNLQKSYINRDVAAYDSLLYDAETAMDTLSTESFTFWFSDQDFQSGTVPQNWGRDDEMASARAMFESNSVQNIAIRLTFGPSFYDNAVGREGQKIINVTDVYLTVVDKPDGQVEPTTYLVQGQRADFRFKVQWVDAKGDSLWRIIYWKDWASGPGKRAPEPASIVSRGEGRARSLADPAREPAGIATRTEAPRSRLVKEAVFARRP